MDIIPRLRSVLAGARLPAPASATPPCATVERRGRVPSAPHVTACTRKHRCPVPPLSRQTAWDDVWNVPWNRETRLLVTDLGWVERAIAPQNNALIPSTDSEKPFPGLKFQGPLSPRGSRSAVGTCQPADPLCLLPAGLAPHQPTGLRRSGLPDHVVPTWPVPVSGRLLHLLGTLSCLPPSLLPHLSGLRGISANCTRDTSWPAVGLQRKTCNCF